MTTDQRRSRGLRRGMFIALQFIALAAVLGGHAWARLKTAESVPLGQHHFYSQDYHVALAILMGRGFELLRLDAPEAAPLLAFVSLQREHVDAEELAAYDTHDRARGPGGPAPGASNRNEFARVLELYTAAGLWSVFGVSWRVIEVFYIGVSVFCGLILFLTARRLSRSFVCGLVAAALFALSPYETRYAVVSIRDTNPLWFAIIAYGVVTCVADRFKSVWANALSYVAAGVAATVGLGWRPDASMLVPVILATLVAVLIWKRRRWRWIGVAVILFLVGARIPMFVIGQLLPDDAPARGTFQFLHVSYYADSTRSVILEEENSFQTLRDDRFVLTLANALHESDPVDEREAWDGTLWGPAYGHLVTRLFHDMAQYHLYDWAVALPGVYRNALADAAGFRGAHFARFELWLPWVAILGGLVGVFAYRERAPIVLSLLVFTGFYACVFLVVLPEEKHLAPFLCPLTLLGALGIWLPARFVVMRRRPPEVFEPPFRPHWPLIASAVFAAAMFLTLGVLSMKYLALAKRQEYLAAIATHETTAVSVSERIVAPRVFAASVPITPQEPRGYLLDIVAGARPGALILRVGPEADGWTQAFENRHTLTPGKRQRFFFSCYTGWEMYGNEHSVFTVLLRGDAEIVAARRLDLRTWNRLPFATVFTDDDAQAGSPPLDTEPAVQLIDRAAPRDDLGLTYSEAIVAGLGPSSRVVVSWEDPASRIIPVAPSTVRVGAGGTWLTPRPEPGAYAAQFPVFTAPEAGRYLFRLDTGDPTGAYTLGILSGDQSRWITLVDTAHDVVAEGEARLALCDLEAGERVVPTLSNLAQGGSPEFLIRGLEIRRLEE